ncbi:MAG: hypothetical protein WCT23_04065 [Candidatus Neomarinimicrobiota bacterium]|jgi:hypothetical protein
MKKIISLILLLLMIFMLQFNWLEGLFPKIHIWIEALIAYAAIIIVFWWNGLLQKKDK